MHNIMCVYMLLYSSTEEKYLNIIKVIIRNKTSLHIEKTSITIYQQHKSIAAFFFI